MEKDLEKDLGKELEKDLEKDLEKNLEMDLEKEFKKDFKDFKKSLMRDFKVAYQEGPHEEIQLQVYNRLFQGCTILRRASQWLPW